MAMAAVVVRNIPDKTLRALKLRAARQGRSTEAEIRSIIEAAVSPSAGVGTALAEIGRAVGGVEFRARSRRKRPVRPANLG